MAENMFTSRSARFKVTRAAAALIGFVKVDAFAHRDLVAAGALALLALLVA